MPSQSCMRVRGEKVQAGFEGVALSGEVFGDSARERRLTKTFDGHDSAVRTGSSAGSGSVLGMHFVFSTAFGAPPVTSSAKRAVAPR